MASADTPNGTQVRTFFSRAQNVQSAPEVDSDSVVYVTQNLGTLHAFNANYSQCWANISSTIFNYLNVNSQMNCF